MLHIAKSWKAWLAALGFAILPLFYAVIWGVCTWHELQEPLAQIPQMGVHSLSLSTEIFDRHGAKIGEFSEERRYFVRLAVLPKHVIQAFLSAEDKNFYQHPGVSPTSILRAILANLRGGGFRQGASTITQQLARMHFLSQEKSLGRKFKEAVLALEIEKRFNKDQILELYLNTIYLGSRSHGVEAAARNFFRKSAKQLTVEEAAMLAALPKSPAHYSPQRHPKRALERRAWVLARMEEDGYLAPGIGKKLAKIRLKVAKGPEDHWSKAPYFVSAVLQEIFRKFEMNGLPRHGLRVYTTLDSHLQVAGERLLKQQLTDFEKSVHPGSIGKDRLEGALVIVDPETGGILAMQGGRRFTQSQFNRSADAVRPIGSLIQPFLLALALERGLSPLSPISTEFVGRLSSRTSNAATTPTLADLVFDPDLKDWHALAPLLGYGSVTDMLKRVRLIRDSFESFDPSRDVRSTPLRVGLSYASLVNGGYPVSSQLVQRVEDRDGHVLFESARLNGREKQALDGKVAFVTRELLAVAPYSELPLDLQKELPQTTSTFGRSVDGRDVWFVGLVPSAVSVFWLGSEHGRISIDMPTEKAKTLSHTFWQQTGTALQNTEGGSRQRFRPPVGVSYLRLPGSKGQGVNIPVLAGTESLGGESSL